MPKEPEPPAPTLEYGRPGENERLERITILIARTVAGIATISLAITTWWLQKEGPGYSINDYYLSIAAACFGCLFCGLVAAGVIKINRIWRK